MKLKNIILSAALVVAFSACDDLFEPTIENHKDAADLENMPSWAVGLLGHAYIQTTAKYLHVFIEGPTVRSPLDF